MWTSNGTDLYDGDCQAGDRAATDAEVAAWQAARDNAVPAQITRDQALQQLDALGKYDVAKAAITGVGGYQADRWYNATWQRADFDAEPLQSLAAGLGIDRDAFFRAAGKL